MTSTTSPRRLKRSGNSSDSKKTEAPGVASSPLDVLCVGHASFDQVFTVSHHPLPDEKLFAEGLVLCGGGPAANAAVQGARLGVRTGFSGYLGTDV
ncbi:MAG TPA: hypothetical protein DCY52_07650, partial [Methylococcaceae bacterium]|nr:hypothetical protein [Methylococcaceae bacterium]